MDRAFNRFEGLLASRGASHAGQDPQYAIGDASICANLANLACLAVLPEDKNPKVAIVSSADGRILRKFDAPPPSHATGQLAWTPDGKAYAYVADRGGVANIFAQPIDGSDPAQLTQFTSGLLFSFAWSRDGSQLACARGGITSDLVLINDLR